VSDIIEKPPASMMKSHAERVIDGVVAVDIQNNLAMIAANLPLATPEEIVKRTEAIFRLADKRMRELGVERQAQISAPSQGPALPPDVLRKLLAGG
jgi:hypothetical protein